MTVLYGDSLEHVTLIAFAKPNVQLHSNDYLIVYSSRLYLLPALPIINVGLYCPFSLVSYCSFCIGWQTRPWRLMVRLVHQLQTTAYIMLIPSRLHPKVLNLLDLILTFNMYLTPFLSSQPVSPRQLSRNSGQSSYSKTRAGLMGLSWERCGYTGDDRALVSCW